MFRDCKSGGYNLEGSQANQQRLTNLILLIAIAYEDLNVKGMVRNRKLAKSITDAYPYKQINITQQQQQRIKFLFFHCYRKS